jgi:hypothetical protein
MDARYHRTKQLSSCSGSRVPTLLWMQQSEADGHARYADGRWLKVMPIHLRTYEPTEMTLRNDHLEVCCNRDTSGFSANRSKQRLRRYHPYRILMQPLSL